MLLEGTIVHILIDRRWHSSILNVRSFSAADCEIYQYLVVAEVTEKLAVRKQAVHKFDGEMYYLREPNELEVMKHYKIEITSSFAALNTLRGNGDIRVHRAWEYH
jgi:hypothetical protein